MKDLQAVAISGASSEIEVEIEIGIEIDTRKWNLNVERVCSEI